MKNPFATVEISAEKMPDDGERYYGLTEEPSQPVLDMGNPFAGSDPPIMNMKNPFSTVELEPYPMPDEYYVFDPKEEHPTKDYNDLPPDFLIPSKDPVELDGAPFEYHFDEDEREHTLVV